ncbi:hypothetical protein [Runella sp.]|jgi:hypothetical protein|uniref:hypothetical protein n=1 Tax=Runella sp. TaxID=1960881 RepID=UPI00262DFC47|nr:hypothetical protein [Runella sp.]
MHKFIVSCFVIAWAGAGLWSKVKNQPQFTYSQDTLRKDTLRKDTGSVAKKIIGLQRDTTFRPDTAAPIIKSEIKIVDLSHLFVCPGSSVLIPFSTEGKFEENTYFRVQIADISGKFVTISDSALQSPIRATLPANRSGLVSVRVVSAKSTSKLARLTLLPFAHARMELNDGSAIAKIGPGQMATYRILLTGAAPWSFTLSDGTTVTNTMINPYTAQVAPAQTGSYKVTSVSNACGSGTTSGELVVQVSQDTLPVITLKAVPKAGFRVCTGTPFQINFNATGKYNVGNGFVVQLSDAAGENFANISEIASESPVMAKTPFGIKPGNYKLRVVSTFPTISSDTVDVNVSATATATLRRDSLEIPEGGSTNLSLDFGGGGPWFVLLSDGTYQNDIRVTPYTIKVTPNNPTAYSITSAGGFCGVGSFSGNAFVKVKIPPATITTGNLSDKIICSGTEITVPFTTTGRFENANRFVVQITDTSGKWVNLPTMGGATALRAKILPPYLKDTLTTQQIRVISTFPFTEGVPTNINVMMPNAASALVTGGAVIRPGGAARIRVTFKNGLPPWSFVLSDGTAVAGTFINPYQLTVNPRTTTEYKVVSINNTCGAGVTNGNSAMIRVETN